MRQLFRQLMVFLLPLALLFAVVEFKLSQFADMYAVRANALRKVAPNVEILVVGHSHAMRGIDPSGLPLPSFNLGFPGQSAILDAKITEEVFRCAPRLRLVIATVGYASLRYRLTDSPSRARNTLYFRAFHLNEEGEASRLFDPERYSLFLVYGPWVSRHILLGTAVPEDPTASQNGWQPSDSTIVGDLGEHAASERAVQVNMLTQRNVIAENMLALRQLLAGASKRGIRVVFVATPIYSTLRTRLTNARWKADEARIEAIATACGATFHDFMADVRFDAADFENADHLNARGAKKFTRILAAEVVSPTLAKRTRPKVCSA